MGFVVFLFVVFECIIALTAIILAFVAFVYYFSTFAEQRIHTMTNLLKKIAIVVIALSLLLPLSGFSWYIFVITLINNLLWLKILNSNFPFISMADPKLVIAFVLTIFSHFFYMLYFLGVNVSFFVVVSYFFFFVWFLPILILSSLCALDEDQATNRMVQEPSQSQPEQSQQYQSTDSFGSSRRGGKSVWNKVIGRLLKKAETSLPHSSSKRD